MSQAKKSPASLHSSTTTPERREKPLCSCIGTALERYFRDLDGHPPPNNLYQMVMDEIECPLLEKVMHHTQGNQRKAAEILGINRSTLHKKLVKHNLINALTDKL